MVSKHSNLAAVATKPTMGKQTPLVYCRTRMLNESTAKRPGATFIITKYVISFQSAVRSQAGLSSIARRINLTDEVKGAHDIASEQQSWDHRLHSGSGSSVPDCTRRWLKWSQLQAPWLSPLIGPPGGLRLAPTKCWRVAGKTN